MAQETPLPPPNRTPILVLDHTGPHAPVTALAFSPDATTLYVGGLDKLVRRYSLKDGKYSPLEPLRVPVGQGNAGAVNAVAVSPDGKWVAVAGRAPLRGEVWSDSDDGIVTETRFLPPLLKRDYGVVYLFDPANPQGGRVIRGAESEVRAIAFANPAPADGPILVTAGNEWDAAGKKFGVVRVFNATTGKEIDSRREFPATTTPPGLAAWATGAGEEGFAGRRRVAEAGRDRPGRVGRVGRSRRASCSGSRTSHSTSRLPSASRRMASPHRSSPRATTPRPAQGGWRFESADPVGSRNCRCAGQTRGSVSARARASPH